MAREHSIQRYRYWYAKLLRLYPKPYRERFGEGMEQTFNDLCRERRETRDRLLGFVLWMFVETSAEIIRENVRFVIMQSTMRSLTAYRAAVGLAVVPVVLLVWFNAAVGTEDDNSGGLILVPVLIFGIAAIIARFRPHGMARAMFATALAQAMVGVIAIIAWGQYFEALILNALFIALFVGSAMLFRRAEHKHN